MRWYDWGAEWYLLQVLLLWLQQERRWAEVPSLQGQMTLWVTGKMNGQGRRPRDSCVCKEGILNPRAAARTSCAFAHPLWPSWSCEHCEDKDAPDHGSTRGGGNGTRSQWVQAFSRKEFYPRPQQRSRCALSPTPVTSLVVRRTVTGMPLTMVLPEVGGKGVRGS